MNGELQAFRQLLIFTADLTRDYYVVFSMQMRRRILFPKIFDDLVGTIFQKDGSGFAAQIF